MKCSDIKKHFIEQIAKENFVSDRSGSRTVELLGASFIADEPSIYGTVDWDYVNRELKWYASQICNINELGNSGNIPQAWKMTANKEGWINSNYGYLIWSEQNGAQYENVLRELSTNPDSRRATMIYTRPTMHKDAFHEGMNDFVCTNAVSYAIRGGKLHCIVQMRSNDVVFGYKNDRAWQYHVLIQLAKDLKVEPGDIYWQVQNLHIYERHWHLVK